jgi:hypothetical protein
MSSSAVIEGGIASKNHVEIQSVVVIWRGGAFGEVNKCETEGKAVEISIMTSLCP